MTRPQIDGVPDQRQTLMDALVAFTVDGAYTEFTEDQKGVLKTGALADLVILSGDIEATPPQAITGLKVAMTICDGRVTYEA